MPKTSGAVLDWVPQKAAQQMHSDAMTRFMPKSRVAFPVGAAQRQVVGASLRIFSIHSREAVKFARTGEISRRRPTRGGQMHRWLA
jgi:hypothetical protein